MSRALHDKPTAKDLDVKLFVSTPILLSRHFGVTVLVLFLLHCRHSSL